MTWLPLPIKLNGDGFTLTMDQEDNLKLFGAFVILLEIAANCNPRGTLIRSDGTPHDCRSLVRLSRMKVRDCEKCLDFYSNVCKWLEIVEIQSSAALPQEGAVKLRDACGIAALHTDITDITLHTDSIYKKFAHLKLTINEKQKILDAGYSINELDEILLDIQNYKKNTKYTSLYLTALKWLKNNKEKKEPEKKEPKQTNKYFDVNAYQKKLIDDQAAMDEQN